MHVINFEECWARPELRGGSHHLLTSHLEQAAKNTRLIPYKDSTTSKLVYIAGLCHDLAKSQREWQKYIRKEKKSGPNHAACSAFLFSFISHRWLVYKKCFDNYRLMWLRVSQDIADHHTELKFYGKPEHFEWIRSFNWDEMDLAGMENWLLKKIPGDLNDINLSSESLDKWIDELDEIIEDIWEKELDIEIFEEDKIYSSLMDELQHWRSLTAALIFGDRVDDKDLTYEEIKREKAESYLRRIEHFCREHSYHPLSGARKKAQDSIIKQYEVNDKSDFYTMTMPTGYGKTITALKLGAKICQEHEKKKIVYVAPYLSILDQTSEAIEKTLGDKPLEHHSLAVPQEEERKEEKEYEAPLQLISETWAHRVVCTSFQQFMKALFPYKAQDSMRRYYMRDSIILIDEPQIFSPEVWNLFLVGIESFIKEYGAKVIFLSATLPPFDKGLEKEPEKLVFKEDNRTPRYKIKKIAPQNETTLAERIYEREENKKGAILNTIKDAIMVHRNLEEKLKKKDQGREENLYLLHGLMIPLHKMIQTDEVIKELEKKDDKTTVIATQVLEAGIDVSFEYLYRSLPVLSSLVQACGRVNRHGEFSSGIVETGEFYREGDKNTRQYIYNRNLQQITDRILDGIEEPTELEAGDMVKRYYEEMFTENSYEAVLQKIEKAYNVNWSSVSSVHPFGGDYFKLPIFVPWDFRQVPEEKFPKTFMVLLEKFEMVDSSHDIYDLYRDYDFIHSLDFEEKKKFKMLFYFFVLNLPVEKALKVANKEDYLQQRVPFLYDDSAYHHELGWQLDKVEESLDPII